jgi:hypothetical protein
MNFQKQNLALNMEAFQRGFNEMAAQLTKEKGNH